MPRLNIPAVDGEPPGSSASSPSASKEARMNNVLRNYNWGLTGGLI
jgi:hypothetical protein